jgi:hypothetical protein
MREVVHLEAESANLSLVSDDQLSQSLIASTRREGIQPDPMARTVSGFPLYPNRRRVLDEESGRSIDAPLWLLFN